MNMKMKVLQKAYEAFLQDTWFSHDLVKLIVYGKSVVLSFKACLIFFSYFISLKTNTKAI